MDRHSSELQTVLSQGWLYRGEGNANLVLSLPKSHQILRMHKTEKPTTILQWFVKWLMQIFTWDRKKLYQYEIKCLRFYNDIIIPLLGEACVHPATNINTERKEIYQLDQELLPLRPVHRKHKQLQWGIATLFRDYAFLSETWHSVDFSSPTYAIEIKPKQGWIPVEDRYFNKCQFCLNQYLKLKNGRIKEISSYCPLDLFSGERERMMKALKSLIYNPQNNLKIFKDGVYVYGENISMQLLYDILNDCFLQLDSINRLTDKFCDLIIQALLKPINYDTKGCANCDNNNSIVPHNNNSNNNTYFNQTKNDKCAFNAEKLPPKCILNRILSMQKLNDLSLHKYCDVYEALIKNKLKFDDWSYVGRLLQDVKAKSATFCPKCAIMEYIKHTKRVHEGSLSELDLVPYLLAAIANDCSFMVTFRKVNRIEGVPDDVLIKIDNWNYLVNVGIFDLYPKPASTILKHKKRISKIQNAYTNKEML